MINADKLESIAFDVFIDNMRSAREERELQEMEGAEEAAIEEHEANEAAYYNHAEAVQEARHDLVHMRYAY